MRRLLFFTVLFASIVGFLPAFAANKTYVNPRFGTTATYPDEVFTKAEPAPENGDGITLLSEDGASLRIWGQNNALDDTPGSLADTIASGLKEVTYRKIGAKWMVISGFEGTVIIYHRSEFGNQGTIHSFELRYPSSLSKHYNRLAESIADSLIGP
jgi:hypothetical protein